MNLRNFRGIVHSGRFLNLKIRTNGVFFLFLLTVVLEKVKIFRKKQKLFTKIFNLLKRLHFYFVINVVKLHLIIDIFNFKN